MAHVARGRVEEPLEVDDGDLGAAGRQDELDARSFCPAHRGRITRGGVRPGELFTALPPEWLAPGRIDLPILGLHGRDDTVSPLAAGVRDFYAAQPRAELVTIAGGPHDVLNDQTHRTVAATIVLFLERVRNGADLAPVAVTERTPA